LNENEKGVGEALILVPLTPPFIKKKSVFLKKHRNIVPESD
jgi:hypothetical protein